jgi:ribonuclease HII
MGKEPPNKVNYPNFSFEKKLWRRGFKFVAGVDEVGRGCFAGPVVTGCVLFSNNLIMEQLSNELVEINDSKKLTPRERELANTWIKKNALAWGIGVGSVCEINNKGIVKATYSGFRRAITSATKKSKYRVDYLLIDAFYIPYVRNLRIPLKKDRKNRRLDFAGKSRQLAIVHGDCKSMSIAAASIIAKVYRDKLMSSLGKQSKYRKYGWKKNKGYGTKDHQKAILKSGITRHHRRKFVETFLSKL